MTSQDKPDNTNITSAPGLRHTVTHLVEPFIVSRLSDLVPPSVLQALQIGISSLRKIPVVIVEPDANGAPEDNHLRYVTPLPGQSTESALCQLLRVTPQQVPCHECDRLAVANIVSEGADAKLRWYRCRMGMMELAVPIIVAERVVAVLISGEKQLPDNSQLDFNIIEVGPDNVEHPNHLPAEVVSQLELMTKDRMAELEAQLQSHADEIANLGQSRYDVERRLRQELLLNQLMIILAQPCADLHELEQQLHSALSDLCDYFRLEYSAVYSQTFAHSPELALVSRAGNAEYELPARLVAPLRSEPQSGEPSFHILTSGGDVARFMEGEGNDILPAFSKAQAMICDFGDPNERITLTIFGPQRTGHTETLFSTAGDDFLERFHYEVGMRAKVARLLLDLQQSDADKTQFLAQTTHEINAGLQTVVEESEWLQYYVEEMAGIKDPEIREPLQKILGEVLRLGARARSSLFHLRGGMPRTEYRLRKAHPLDRLVQSCIDPFRTVAAARNITIIMDDSLRRLPHVRFDWEMMKTVFMNLIDNAVKYSHYNRRIRIFGDADEEWVRISVEDFGLGIPEDEYDRIFKPYVRASQRDPRRFIWGSGLGLAVAHDIVQTHDGVIEVKSIPTAREPITDDLRRWENYLTTFTVCLPLAQEE